MRCQNDACLYYYYDINTEQEKEGICPACGSSTISFDANVEKRKSPFQNAPDTLRRIMLQPVEVFARKNAHLSKAISQTTLKFYTDYKSPSLKGMKQQVLKMMAVSCFANKEYQQTYDILKPMFDEADNMDLMSLISETVIDMYETVLLMQQKVDDLYNLEIRALDCCKELYGEDDPRSLERFCCLVQAELATKKLDKEQTKEKLEEIVSWSKKVKGELKMMTQTMLSAYDEAKKNLSQQ